MRGSRRRSEASGTRPALVGRPTVARSRARWPADWPSGDSLVPGAPGPIHLVQAFPHLVHHQDDAAQVDVLAEQPAARHGEPDRFPEAVDRAEDEEARCAG